MNPADLRRAIVADLSAKLPAVTVAPLGGRLDEAELKRLAVRAPGVLVALMGVDGVGSKGGAPHATFSLAAIIVCGTGRKGEPAEEGALALVGGVLEALEGNRFGCDVDAPSTVRAENLYSGELDAGHTALWAVTWNQTVDVSNNIRRPELDDFLRCYVRETPDGAITQKIDLPGPETPATETV